MYKVLSHYDLDLYFLNDKWHLSFFYVITGHLYNFFGQMSIQVLCPFFCWIFSGLIVEFQVILNIYFG